MSEAGTAFGGAEASSVLSNDLPGSRRDSA